MSAADLQAAPNGADGARRGFGGATLGLAWRYALRELRGGLRGFYIFLACIAIGVMAIAGVNATSRSLADGLAREGRTILGGDLAFQLIQREASADERAWLARLGDVSVAATMRAMIRRGDGQLALGEVKAVDNLYPLTGRLATDPAIPLGQALAEKDGAFGAIADPALMTRLGLKAGDRVEVGSARFEIRAALSSEPDALAGGGIGFAPRFLISLDALRATGLVQPGSLVRWLYRVRGADAPMSERQSEAIVEAARAAFPQAGWDIRTRSNASPRLASNIERFSQFLTLVGLAALIVGGVGVANAVKGHIDRRRDVAATLKALGAPGGRVFLIYLIQILILAGIGTLIGAAAGVMLPYLITAAFGHLIPLPLDPAFRAIDLVAAIAYGLLTALAFALWPLGRAHDVPVSELFRDNLGGERRFPRWRYVAQTALAVALLAGLAVLLAFDRRIALIFAGSAAAALVLLGLVALGLMTLVARMPRPRRPMVRLAMANIHRPGALTPSVIISLGLGIALLVTVVQVDFNLRRQFTAALPDHAPSFYFIDIPASDAGAFDAYLRSIVPASATAERVPMLRGRIVAVRGVAAENLPASREAEWVLQSDRGITYAASVPDGSRIVAGSWWPADHDGPPLVSFERKIADGLGLKIGDDVTVNVLGRDITVKVANLRELDWESLGINFVMVFSPNTFRGAPHSHIATLAFENPDAATEAQVMKLVAERFPTVTTVRVRDALDAIGSLVANLVLGIRGASAITLLTAILVLGGAIAAGRRQRVYDAVILRTLGATRRQLIAAYLVEYAALGLAAGAFGMLAGSLAAWMVVARLMSLSFVWFPGAALVVTLAALVTTLALGFLGTVAALRQKPAPVLRHL